MKNYGVKGRFILEAKHLAAIKLLTECGALSLMKAGRINERSPRLRRSGQACGVPERAKGSSLATYGALGKTALEQQSCPTNAEG